MDGLINLVIILIPLAIFIGRAVLLAKSKRQQPQQPPPPPPVNYEEEFEDDGNEDLPHWMRVPKQRKEAPEVVVVQRVDDESLPHWERGGAKKEAAQKEAGKKKEPAPYAIFGGEADYKPYAADAMDTTPLPAAQGHPTGAKEPPVVAVAKASAPSAPAGRGFPNLNHLSPLKQAVIMAEILGPPKGTK